MAKSYPFIDIAVLDGVRERLVAGDALCVLTPAFDEVIWSNAAGARLLGFDSMDEAAGARPGIGQAAQRAMAGAQAIVLPDGSHALLLAESGAGAKPDCIIEGLGGGGCHAAVLDGAGEILARSDGFDSIGIERRALTELAAELRGEADRMIKRRISAKGAMLPAGAGLLADEPQTCLLLVIAPENALPLEPTLRGAERLADIGAAKSLETPALDARHYFAAEAEDGFDIADTQEPQTPDEGGPEPRGIPELGEAEPAAADMPFEPPEDAAIAVEDIEDEGSVMEPQTGESVLVPLEPEPHEAEFFGSGAGLPVRFVWRISASGAFSEISPEFAQAVGPHSADVLGRTFRDVAQVYGLDPGEEICELLDRKDTWSGRSVFWPIEGTDLRAPVDLAALPVYGKDRAFDGFKGFGVVRLADAVVDAEGIGLSLTGPRSPAPQAAAQEIDPWKGERPALAISQKPAVPDFGGKIIRLEERRALRGDDAAPSANALSDSERSAFREIAERLRGSGEAKAVFGKREAPPETAAPAFLEDEISSAETAYLQIEDVDALALDPEPDGGFAADAEPADQIAAPLDSDPAAEKHDASEPVAEAALPVDAPDADRLRYEEMLRDLLETVDKPIDTDLPAADAPEDAPAGKYDEMLRDILETIDERAIDEKMIRVMPAEEILRVAEEHHRQELEEPSASLDDDAAEADTGHAQTDDQDLAPLEDFSPPPEPAAASSEAEPGEYRPPSLLDVAYERPAPDTSILSRLPMPVMIYGGRHVHFANPAFLELTGYASAGELEILGGIDQLIAGEHAEESGRISIRIKGNGLRPFNAMIRSVPWDGMQAMMLTIRDDALPEAAAPALPASAGETQKIQDLRQEAAELSSILDTATDGVVILDSGGLIRSLNHSAEALFGFDPAEVTGKPFSLLLATESQRSVSDYISGMSGSGVASVMNDGREVIGREAHGRFIPLFMTLGRLEDSDGFCAVLRDMTQWKRAEEELIEARRAAEEASATKTEFLTRVSHEIRTPLNAIIGFSELMSEERFGPIGNQRYLDYSKDIYRSGRHVLDLVNDLLDISKIEAGEQEMNFAAVALNETLAETVALMQPQANRERVIIRSSFASTLPDVVADLRSVKQIALNLLSNAVRYTGAGGQVIVSTAYELTGDVVIRVRDTGAGMSQSDIDQAMKPFKQLNTLKRGRGDGTGLGLPLTKAMVEGNRARFSLTSAPGKGTLVEITFPSMRVLAN